jgi:molybdate transport system ATP-binding protein
MTLRRGGRRVLSRIDWTIRPGERWVLVGANGSGKTQLLKVIAGIVRPSSAAQHSLRWHLKGEWHAVPYEIREHIAYLGPERQDKYQRYAWDMRAEALIGTGIHGTDIALDALSAAQLRQVQTLLARLGLAALARRRFLELSYGERRMTLLARALISRPGLLLLDEVFTGLDGENHLRLLTALARLRGRLPVVTVTHQPADVPANATHLLVLEEGRIVHAGPLRAAPLRRYLGAASAGGGAAQPARAGKRAARSAPLVRLRDASVYLEERCALRAVSMSVCAGEFWVIHGANGAGKTTLLRTLYGDHGVAAGGAIERSGIVPGVPLERFRARTGIAAPYLHARYPRAATVREVVLSGRHGSIGVHRPATRADRDATRRVLRRLGLAKWADRSLAELSYGQTRRVLFARALVARPRLLLLDEPFDSIDAATRGLLSREIARLAREGVAIVVTAHAFGEWGHRASHEVELAAGEVRHSGEARPAQVTGARRASRDGLAAEVRQGALDSRGVIRGHAEVPGGT